jgi:negative regulator of sigma E activity
MLAANKEALASSSFGNQLKRWMQTSKSLIAATAMIALVAAVWVGQYKLERGAFNQDQYTNVQIHSLSEPQELASNNIRLKYDAAYKEFLQQQGTLAAHHQSSAKLRLNDNGWTLATCKNELLQISDELLNILKDVQRIDTNLVLGDSVNILFAMDGRIIQIVKSPEPLRC